MNKITLLFTTALFALLSLQNTDANAQFVKIDVEEIDNGGVVPGKHLEFSLYLRIQEIFLMLFMVKRVHHLRLHPPSLFTNILKAVHFQQISNVTICLLTLNWLLIAG